MPCEKILTMTTIYTHIELSSSTLGVYIYRCPHIKSRKLLPASYLRSHALRSGKTMPPIILSGELQARQEGTRFLARKFTSLYCAVLSVLNNISPDRDAYPGLKFSEWDT